MGFFSDPSVAFNVVTAFESPSVCADVQQKLTTNRNEATSCPHPHLGLDFFSLHVVTCPDRQVRTYRPRLPSFLYILSFCPGLSAPTSIVKWFLLHRAPPKTPHFRSASQPLSPQRLYFSFLPNCSD